MSSVLVVDDNQRICDAIRKYLEAEGFIVETGATVADALGRLSGDPLDVVVTDICLPDGDGIDILRQVRDRQPEAKVVIITGNPDMDTSIRAMRLGAFDYLAKPFTRDAICRAVGSALRFKRIEDENRRHQRELEQLVQQRTAALKRMLKDLVEALTSAMEMRDPYTTGHQHRVSQLAVAIGAELGLPDTRLEGLRLAGLLHDIGKLQIPAEILAKPARLSHTEFSLVQGHSDAGYRILHRIEFPWPVARMVRQHHERMDGTGYPDGLKNGEILQESRILAIADVVEAVSSHRPYRPALGVDAALRIIRDESGRTLDPEAVDACTRLFDEERFSFEAT